MAKSKLAKISVVIPTYNSWRTLERCINSIQNQTLTPFEVIVIDNASSDKTSINVAKKFPKVKLVTLNKNTGVTGGRNAGIEKADKSSDHLFFFDHDMIADRKMLSELVAVCEGGKDVGVVTPKIYYLGNNLRPNSRKGGKRIWSAGTGIDLWTGKIFFRGGNDHGQYDKEEEVQVAPAAMLVKKEVLKKVQRFDERYFATYEDTDFCFRARKFGFKTYYSPKAIAYHDLSESPKDEADRLLRRAYWVGRNRVLFMKDFGESYLVFLIFLPVFFAYYAVMAIKYNRLSSLVDYLVGVINGIRGK